MQKSLSVALCLFGLSIGTQAEAGDNHLNHSSMLAQPQMLAVADLSPVNIPDIQPTAIVNRDVSRVIPGQLAKQPMQQAKIQYIAPNDNKNVADQAKYKNYAPFMRTLMMSANHLTGSQNPLKAARVMKGGRQVIVLGGK